jgi:hypothetical protein
MENWQQLLKKTDVEGTPNIMTVSDLLTFETENNLVLPEDYKDFCQVFGSGLFGNEIRIQCPPKTEESPNIFAMLISYLDELKLLNEFSDAKSKQIFQILNNGLLIGDTFNGELFMFDLSSSSKEDDSYDIYIIDMDSFESYGTGINKVGRDFYEFISDAALNNRTVGFTDDFDYPDEMFESKFIPLHNYEDYIYQITRMHIAYFPEDFVNWLLGSSESLILEEPSDRLDKYKKFNGIILRTQIIILQIQASVRPDPEIPLKFFNDRSKLQSEFPNKQIKQVVIYLKQTNSPIVHQTSYETSENDFEVIRIWEQPTEVFMKTSGLLPLAVLSDTTDREETFRQIQESRLLDTVYAKIMYDFFIGAMARIVLDKEVVVFRDYTFS